MIDRAVAAVALVGCAVLGVSLFISEGALKAQQLAYSQLQTTMQTERAQVAKAYTKSLEDLRAAQDKITDKYQGALNDARIRETSTRTALAAARAESDSLRTQSVSAARRLADLATPDAAVREYATTVNGLFDQCQRNYQDMAGRAQGHADDVRTLLAAWPVTGVRQ